MRDVKLIIGAAVCFCLVGFSYANDNAAARAFAKVNANKYKNELSKQGIVKVGSTITLLGNLDIVDIDVWNLKYNADTSEAVINTKTMDSLLISEKCKRTGGFVGENAYGVKRNVSKKTCDRFFANDGAFYTDSGMDLRGVAIKMTPDQFRAIHQKGIKTEIDFTVGHPRKEFISEFRSVSHPATVEDPEQITVRVLTLNGTIKSVRWYLPGAKEPTHIWSLANDDHQIPHLGPDTSSFSSSN